MIRNWTKNPQIHDALTTPMSLQRIWSLSSSRLKIQKEKIHKKLKEHKKQALENNTKNGYKQFVFLKI